MTGEHNTRPLIDGQWRGTDNEIKVTDLTTGETLTRIETASTEQALTAAHDVKRQMARTTVPERVAWLSAIADGIEARKADLAETFETVPEMTVVCEQLAACPDGDPLPLLWGCWSSRRQRVN